MNDTYVVVEGMVYYEKSGEYYTTSINADKSIDWKSATKINIRDGRNDLTSVHRIFDALIIIRQAQRNLMNETRMVSV